MDMQIKWLVVKKSNPMVFYNQNKPKFNFQAVVSRKQAQLIRAAGVTVHSVGRWVSDACKLKCTRYRVGFALKLTVHQIAAGLCRSAPRLSVAAHSAPFA